MDISYGLDDCKLTGADVGGASSSIKKQLERASHSMHDANSADKNALNQKKLSDFNPILLLFSAALSSSYRR